MYQQILKLKELLTEENIPFKFEPLHDGYAIVIYNSNDDWLCEAVEYDQSYGHRYDLIEISGAITKEEGDQEYDELGGLTAKEVCKRFTYCYKNNTSTYKEQGTQTEDEIAKQAIVVAQAESVMDKAEYDYERAMRWYNKAKELYDNAVKEYEGLVAKAQQN